MGLNGATLGPLYLSACANPTKMPKTDPLGPRMESEWRTASIKPPLSLHMAANNTDTDYPMLWTTLKTSHGCFISIGNTMQLPGYYVQ